MFLFPINDHIIILIFKICCTSVIVYPFNSWPIPSPVTIDLILNKHKEFSHAIAEAKIR